MLRRYEPTNRERASQIIEGRAAAQPPTASNRWALTGQNAPNATEQRPLGRAAIPELQGVRRRPSSAPETATPAPATPAASTETR